MARCIRRLGRDDLPRSGGTQRLCVRRRRSSASHQSEGVLRQQVLPRLRTAGPRLPRGLDSTENCLPCTVRRGLL